MGLTVAVTGPTDEIGMSAVKAPLGWQPRYTTPQTLDALPRA